MNGVISCGFFPRKKKQRQKPVLTLKHDGLTNSDWSCNPMTWAEAAVRNSNSCSPVGDGSKILIFFPLSAARQLCLFVIGGSGVPKILIFFPLSAARRLYLFLIGGAACRKFTNEKLFPK
jgi:hypothetical protein